MEKGPEKQGKTTVCILRSITVATFLLQGKFEWLCIQELWNSAEEVCASINNFSSN